MFDGFTTSGAWPFFVQLIMPGSGLCGGVLISPGKVLTAAHCLSKFRGKEVLCYLGFDNNSTTMKRVIKAKRWKIHEGYAYDYAAGFAMSWFDPKYTEELLKKQGKGVQVRELVDVLATSAMKINGGIDYRKAGICDLALVYLNETAYGYSYMPIAKRLPPVGTDIYLLGRGMTNRKIPLLPTFPVPVDLQGMSIKMPPAGKYLPGSIIFPADAKHQDHGDSGGAYFYKEDGILKVFGIVSAGFTGTKEHLAMSTVFYSPWIYRYL